MSQIIKSLTKKINTCLPWTMSTSEVRARVHNSPSNELTSKILILRKKVKKIVKNSMK